MDLYVGRVKAKNILMFGDGQGRFTDAPVGPATQDDATVTLSVSVGDFDRDGSIDIFVANGNSMNALYMNNGRGTFTASPGKRGRDDLLTSTHTELTLAADFDDNGLAVPPQAPWPFINKGH